MFDNTTLTLSVISLIRSGTFSVKYCKTNPAAICLASFLVDAVAVLSIDPIVYFIVNNLLCGGPVSLNKSYSGVGN